MHCSQSRGVTVAQVILVHFVEVRILTGLPFFCLFSGFTAFSSLFETIRFRMPDAEISVFSAEYRLPFRLQFRVFAVYYSKSNNLNPVIFLWKNCSRSTI